MNSNQYDDWLYIWIRLLKQFATRKYDAFTYRHIAFQITVKLKYAEIQVNALLSTFKRNLINPKKLESRGLMATLPCFDNSLNAHTWTKYKKISPDLFGPS